jgi:acetyl-CoA carboxylase / biotin carboxylase 1
MEVKSPVTGSLALILYQTGSQVQKDEEIANIEVMKMFLPVISPSTGAITWLVKLGQVIQEGQIIAIIK